MFKSLQNKVGDAAAEAQLTTAYCSRAWRSRNSLVWSEPFPQRHTVLSRFMRGLKTPRVDAVVVWRQAGPSCAGEELGSLPFSVAGRVQSWSVQVWFPLRACHSPHVIDNTEKRGKTVHLGSIYLHYSAWGPSLSFLPLTHTHPNKHCHDCMQMDNMSS